MTAAPTAGSSLAAGYRRFVRRRVALLAALAVAVLAAAVADVATGPSSFPIARLLAGLLDPAALGAAERVILWDIRLPQAAIALLVGAALGLAGVELQTALDNPMASPLTLGIQAAATFGAAVAIVFGIAVAGADAAVAVPAAAFVAAAAAASLLYALSRLYGAGADVVVLFGIALLFAMNALVALVQFVADPDALQQVVFWTMGSLAKATWPKIAVLLAVLAVCVPASLGAAAAMTALRSGDEHARSLGVPVERLRLLVLARASLLTAAAVAFVGAIGFIGLVGPHIARLALGEDHRLLAPGSALAGALVLSLASIASKALLPGIVIPVGIVTALVGVPLFMALILSRRRRP